MTEIRIYISQDDERFTVRVEEAGLHKVKWYDNYQLALIKGAAELTTHKQRGHVVIFINEVKNNVPSPT